MLCSNEIVVMYVLVVLLVYIHFLSIIMGMYCHTDNGKRNYASLEVVTYHVCTNLWCNFRIVLAQNFVYLI